MFCQSRTKALRKSRSEDKMAANRCKSKSPAHPGGVWELRARWGLYFSWPAQYFVCVCPSGVYLLKSCWKFGTNVPSSKTEWHMFKDCFNFFTFEDGSSFFLTANVVVGYFHKFCQNCVFYQTIDPICVAGNWNRFIIWFFGGFFKLAVGELLLNFSHGS